MKQTSQTDGVKPNSPPERLSRSTTETELLARQEFRADLSKKLRTPLNDIMGFAQLLATDTQATSDDDSAQQILAAARRLLDVIDIELGDAAAPPRHRQPPAAPPASSSSDLLYIEDDPANLVLVERTLRRRPSLRLLHAANGEAGLEVARTHRPALILLDLNLPDIHGAEVLRRLRQEPATANLPVVVISADATASQIERLLTAGARDYLTKPFEIQNFLAVVDQILDPNSPSLPNA